MHLRCHFSLISLCLNHLVEVALSFFRSLNLRAASEESILIVRTAIAARRFGGGVCHSRWHVSDGHHRGELSHHAVFGGVHVPRLSVDISGSLLRMAGGRSGELGRLCACPLALSSGRSSLGIIVHWVRARCEFRIHGQFSNIFGYPLALQCNSFAGPVIVVELLSHNDSMTRAGRVTLCVCLEDFRRIPYQRLI